MKFVLTLVGLLAAVPIWLVSAVYAQTTLPHNAPSSNQWVSHQLNQPPPNASKNNISRDRLNEIEQLYLQAKKESDGKAADNHNDKK
ncbi:MAG: hypothetical protein WBG50_11565 [Desulfomonilaceae bacterium]